MMDGKTPKEWQAREISVAGTAIGKLLVERYEIAEQITDIQDEHPTDEHDEPLIHCHLNARMPPNELVTRDAWIERQDGGLRSGLN